MNQLTDGIQYDPNIPYQQVNDQATFQYNYVQKPDELGQLIKNINIPDKVEFEHIFKLNTPCCGDTSQYSSFDIQGIGELVFGVVERCCQCQLICYCCVCQDCDAHTFPTNIYLMENQNIRLEFWHLGFGKVSVDNKPILEFVQTNPNQCDYFYSHCLSSYPKLKIKFPYDENKELQLRPEKNNCPESIIGALTVAACLDIFTTSKNYYVDGLTQGKCQIINTRNPCQALSKISALQGCCCCPLINYPNFSVQFENVTQIDKIAIIMGLVHISMYKQWVITGTNLLLLRDKLC